MPARWMLRQARSGKGFLAVFKPDEVWEATPTVVRSVGFGGRWALAPCRGNLIPATQVSTQTISLLVSQGLKGVKTVFTSL